MDKRTGEEEPPKSTDLDGWRQVIASNRLQAFRLEALAAAFQDLGDRDTQVRHALAKHLSDCIVHMLRPKVGFNHPNEGWDIIFRTHEYIFTALLRPDSADGRNLREAFGSRVLFRLKDAIVDEQRERRIPDVARAKRKPTTEGTNGGGEEHDVGILASEEDARWDEEAETSDVPQRTGSKKQVEGLLDETRELDEQINVDGILNCIHNPKKRLAFYLYMDDIPFKSKRPHVRSIAQALNISEKTAREWVKEVQQLLAENEDVKDLKKSRMGARK